MREPSAEYLQYLYLPVQVVCCDHAIADMSFRYPKGKVSRVRETAFTLAQIFGWKVCPKLCS